MKEYYTPAIEEFHVGFNYEILLKDGDWVAYYFDENNRLLDICDDLNEGKIRVAYLDREDIESCGWTKQSTTPNSINFTIKKTDLFLSFFTDSKEIIIDNGCTHESLNTFFQGTIRNISELKKLMKQLNIQVP